MESKFRSARLSDRQNFSALITLFKNLPQAYFFFACITFAFTAWFWLLRFVDPAEMTDLGLVSVLPFFSYILVFGLLGSFLWILHFNPTAKELLAGHLFVLISFIYATPAVLYKTLRYSWAWKHMGVIDFIIRHQKIDRYSRFLDAYHNWPGFFAFNAFLTEAAGLDRPLAYAIWVPLFFGLANATLVYLLVDSLSSLRRLKWMATFVFVLTNWIGQDYFAPQSLAFFQYLLLIVCILRWFRPIRTLKFRSPYRIGWVDYLIKISRGIFKQDLGAKNLSERRDFIGLKRVMIILIFTNIVASHQLTPIFALLVVAGLVITRRCSWVVLPFILFIILVAWNTLVAGPYFYANILGEFEDFGRVAANTKKTVRSLGIKTSGQQIVSLVGRVLTVAIAILAMLGGLRRLRYKRVDITLWVLTLAPFSLLIMGSYGGEVLFRVYLFAIPFLSILAASLFFPTNEHGRKRISFLASASISILLFSGFLFAYFGKDRQYYFSPDEVNAAEYLYSTAPPNSLLIEGSKNYPSQFTNYEHFFYVPISRESPDAIQTILEQPVEELERWMSNERYEAAYLLITTSQKAEVEANGVMPQGALSIVEKKLINSGKFALEYDTPNAKIYRLKGRFQNRQGDPNAH